ncbi:MAG: NAD+ synthase [Spirochaetia bacterium]|nr:NAD+ synthase [Spirochaetia bacterium]
MKITIAQLNPTVGDIEGNFNKIKEALLKSKQDLSDLLVFPELFLTGYPPKDLLERKDFISKTQIAVENLKEQSKNYSNTGILIGAPVPTQKRTGRPLFNSAILIHNGKILLNQNKSLLPMYDVFDEARYFEPADNIQTIKFKNEILGISICEDAWNEPQHFLNYEVNPMEKLAAQKASLFINISASPFQIGKEETRFQIFQNHVKKHKVPFVFVNQVGANDDLIFDGRSFCIDRDGNLMDTLDPFNEQIKTIDLKLKSRISYNPQDKIESLHQALVLGVKDYFKKTSFSKAIIGLSGGIDSAVTCCLAKEAIGSENIIGISMPSPFSSKGSVEDSKILANNLGIEFKEIPISDVFNSYLDTLKNDFKKEESSIAEENIQARIRGNILMAYSNKFGHLVLSTGNKSEMAVGYCTLYGDMSGGLAVLADVPKTYVYQLAEYINRKKEIIPREILEKPPSAELKPNQKDQDTLPDYEILDKLLYYYIDENFSLKELLNLKFDPEVTKWVVQTVNKNEYKRRQAAPGLKVTSKAFGTGRRMPIAAKY